MEIWTRKESFLKLTGQGLLAASEDRLYLTPYGLDVSNAAMAEFLLD